MWIESAISKQFSICYLKELEFSDASILEGVKKQSQRALCGKDFALANALNCDFFEQSLKEAKPISIEIKMVNQAVGYGVFAREELSFFSYVGEYTGIVRKRCDGDKENNYLFSYVIGGQDTTWVIDAEKKGNFTRFINHSSTPNLGSAWLISGGIAHVIFYANRRIRAGEQLTTDYGASYWRNRAPPLGLEN